MSSSKDWIQIKKNIEKKFYNIPLYEKHREILIELFKEKDGHFAYESFDILNDLVSDEEGSKEFFWENLAEQILIMQKRIELKKVNQNEQSNTARYNLPSNPARS